MVEDEVDGVRDGVFMKEDGEELGDKIGLGGPGIDDEGSPGDG
jgi:hypothetical protein